MDDIFDSLKTFKFNIHDHDPDTVYRWFQPEITEETKMRISETKKGIKQTPKHIKNRVASTIGFKQSEHQKEVATTLFQKEWIVTNTQGKSIKITNLNKFCKENGLDQGNMVKVSKGIIKQSKGWTCVKIEA